MWRHLQLHILCRILASYHLAPEWIEGKYTTNATNSFKIATSKVFLNQILNNSQTMNFRSDFEAINFVGLVVYHSMYTADMPFKKIEINK